jgi:hypothetical protein
MKASFGRLLALGSFLFISSASAKELVPASRTPTSIDDALCPRLVINSIKSTEYWMIGEFFKLQGRITLNRLAALYLNEVGKSPELLGDEEKSAKLFSEWLLNELPSDQRPASEEFSRLKAAFQEKPASVVALSEYIRALSASLEKGTYSEDAAYLELLSQGEKWAEENPTLSQGWKIVNPIRMVLETYRGHKIETLRNAKETVLSELKRNLQKRTQLVSGVRGLSVPSEFAADYLSCLNEKVGESPNERFFSLTQMDVQDRRYRGLRVGHVRLSPVIVPPPKTIAQEKTMTPTLPVAPKITEVVKTTVPSAPRPYFTQLNPRFGLNKEEFEGLSQEVRRGRFQKWITALVMAMDDLRACYSDSKKLSRGNLILLERSLMAYYLEREEAILPNMDREFARLNSENRGRALSCIAGLQINPNRREEHVLDVERKVVTLMFRAMELKKKIEATCSDQVFFSWEKVNALSFMGAGGELSAEVLGSVIVNCAIPSDLRARVLDSQKFLKALQFISK